LFNQGMNSIPAAQQMLGAAFNPNMAQYNQQQGQVADQSNVMSAMAGLAGTPYGASVGANALGNFDINFQNNLLSQMQQGASGYNSLLSAGAGALLGGQQLGGNAATTANQLALAPYQVGSTLAGGALQGLSGLSGLQGSTANLGQSAYQLPQQAISDLMQYMGLGQSASQLSGQLGQEGFNQTALGLAGGLSGVNSLFGANSLLGGSSGLFGSGGLSGLFGGGAGAATGAAADASAGASGVLGSAAPLALAGS
jgi:hypothetical protein